MSSKVFSGVDYISRGNATEEVTPGCLVLEGGAFRGVYGEGVLDAMMEAGINMETTVGVSAGAMNAVNYLSGQIGKSARTNLTYRHDPRYVNFLRLYSDIGVINHDFALNQVPGEPTNLERFYDPKQKFYAVATNLNTGEAEFFDKDKKTNDIFKAIQASASMPYISRKVYMKGQPYLDGGCDVKVPYQWAIDQGYDKIVVIRTRPRDYRYEDTDEDPKAYLFYPNYPEFAKKVATMNQRYNEACDEMDELEKQGRIFVVAPSRYIPVERLETDMEKLGSLYVLGYEDGSQVIGDMLDYLNS